MIDAWIEEYRAAADNGFEIESRGPDAVRTSWAGKYACTWTIASYSGTQAAQSDNEIDNRVREENKSLLGVAKAIKRY